MFTFFIALIAFVSGYLFQPNIDNFLREKKHQDTKAMCHLSITDTVMARSLR